jgi:riboflavin synthase
MKWIGVVDTMFARVDMGGIAVATLRAKQDFGARFDVARRTVPGFKDLAVAAKRLIQLEGCEIVLALGMPGAGDLDRTCAHEASLGIMMAQLITTTPILEVFVHEQEGQGDDARLLAICEDRCAKHALNAHDMIFDAASLIARAGQGVRQGQADAGPIAIPIRELVEN